MHSFHQSRARILFNVACAFGIAASCVVAWMQTYATAMLPAAAIAALFGLVHAFDMVRRTPTDDKSVAATEPVPEQVAPVEPFATREPEPVVVDELPKYTESPVEAVVETGKKRNRKASKQPANTSVGRRLSQVADPEVVPVVEAVVPDFDDPEPMPEPETAPEPAPEPELHVVDSTPDEPEYVPATPLFETDPFVRHQRAAFGRKAR